MKKYLKITVIIAAFCAQQSYGMFSRAAMSMHAKRFVPAVLARAKNVPLRSLATYNVLPRFMPNKQDTKNNKQQFNWRNKNSYAAFAAVAGLSGYSLFALNKNVFAEEQPTLRTTFDKFNPRKKEKEQFLAKLRSKPWGDLANYWINKLQQEEDLLHHELLKLLSNHNINLELFEGTIANFDKYEISKLQNKLIENSYKVNEQDELKIRKGFQALGLDDKSLTFFNDSTQLVLQLGQSSIVIPMGQPRVSAMRDFVRVNDFNFFNKAQPFTIAHEAVHFLFDDLFQGNLIGGISIDGSKQGLTNNDVV